MKKANGIPTEAQRRKETWPEGSPLLIPWQTEGKRREERRGKRRANGGQTEGGEANGGQTDPRTDLQGTFLSLRAAPRRNFSRISGVGDPFPLWLLVRTLAGFVPCGVPCNVSKAKVLPIPWVFSYSCQASL
jgi:hypothetical protein